jgi:hypothetical protein
MYENVCGNCVRDICMTFHKRAFDFFTPLQVDLTIFQKLRDSELSKEMSTLSQQHTLHINFRTQLPYLSTIILNHSILFLLFQTFGTHCNVTNWLPGSLYLITFVNRSNSFVEKVLNVGNTKVFVKVQKTYVSLF